MGSILKIKFYVVYVVMLLFSGKNDDPIETKHGFITVADSKLYYETSGSGPAIVLLHGGFLDSRMWENEVKAFTKDYQVITCDLRGHGATIDGDSSYFMYEAIRMLLDTLKIKEATIAGLSLGAMIATDFAIEFPQYTYKLVLISPGLNKLDTIFRQDNIITKYNNLSNDAVENKYDTALAAEYFIRCWFDGPYRLSSETSGIARKKALDMVTATMKTHQLLHWVRFAEPPAIQRLKNISCPVLIIIADRDNYRISKNAEALAAGIKEARIVTIQNAAHIVNMEKPSEVDKLILDFVNENKRP